MELNCTHSWMCLKKQKCKKQTNTTHTDVPIAQRSLLYVLAQRTAMFSVTLLSIRACLGVDSYIVMTEKGEEVCGSVPPSGLVPVELKQRYNVTSPCTLSALGQDWTSLQLFSLSSDKHWCEQTKSSIHSRLLVFKGLFFHCLLISACDWSLAETMLRVIYGDVIFKTHSSSICFPWFTCPGVYALQRSLHSAFVLPRYPYGTLGTLCSKSLSSVFGMSKPTLLQIALTPRPR